MAVLVSYGTLVRIRPDGFPLAEEVQGCTDCRVELTQDEWNWHEHEDPAKVQERIALFIEAMRERFGSRHLTA